MSHTNSIVWTVELLGKFREARSNAVKSKKDTFIFLGHEFDVKYAKYLIEYLEGRL